jgi:hypothetical protein
MRCFVFPFAAAVAALPMGPVVATAGCHHAACYEKVRTPDIYATVARPVVVAPARSEIIRTPAVHGTVVRQIEVAPARAWHSHSPPVYGSVARKVVVSPGGFRWQYTVDRHGRERLCKVYVAPVTRTVQQTVLVKPAERHTHVAPALYKTIHQPVVLRPTSVHTVHHPAVVDYRREKVLVRPGGYHWQLER